MAETHDSSENSPDNGPLNDEGTVARPSPTGVMRLLNLWFGFSLDVTRLAYAASGLGLMVLKYGVEAGAIQFTPAASFRRSII